MKRVLILSDLHCGHRCGLTPPGWQYDKASEASRQKWHAIQADHWKWYTTEIDKAKPFGVIVVNGDAIDGKGERAGGVEALTTDRHEQVDIAAQCIKRAAGKGTKIVIVRGTPYHTGTEEDFEDVLGGEVGATKVGNHEWVEVEGVIFDCKHMVGSSTIPHGRHTAIARDRLWNLLWAERGEAPRGDVIVRSHVHYHVYSGGPGWLALTTPALQALGSRYGARACSGLVDFGFLTFDVDRKDFDMSTHIARLESAQPKKLTL